MKVCAEARLVVFLCVTFLFGCSAKSKIETQNQLSEAQIQKIWEVATSPSSHHKLLNPLVGSWKAKIKTWSSLSGDPEVSHGTETISWIMDGRFLKEEFTGTAMGRQLQGLGFIGYDNIRKAYFSSWIDSMSTQLMINRGQIDSTGKILTFSGVNTDPVSLRQIRTRSVLTLISANKRNFEIFETQQDGSEIKVMEIMYLKR